MLGDIPPGHCGLLGTTLIIWSLIALTLHVLELVFVDFGET
jgi:hypothetical protein